MTPVDRLIKARKQQRDAAAEELAKARQRLDQATHEVVEINQTSRDNLQRSVGTDALTISNLESMDTLRQWADKAQQISESAMEEARQLALESHRMLRQVEILRERAIERKNQEGKRRERRELDEIASRLKKIFVIPLLLILCQENGCRQEEHFADSTEVDAEVVTVDGGSSLPDVGQPKKDTSEKPDAGHLLDADAAPPVPDAMVFTMNELIALTKLKKRSKELEAKEQKLLEQEKLIAAKKNASPAIKPPVVEASKPKITEESQLLTTDLATVIKDMNNRAAAAMLAEMEPGIAAAALRHLPPKHVAQLLGQMPPDRGALIGARLNVTPRTPTVDAGTTIRSASKIKSSRAIADGGTSFNALPAREDEK
jgi:flagellar export protein FliJ